MKPKKSDLNAAVKHMRVYLGSIGRVRFRDEQRFYDRVSKYIQKISDATNILPEDVWSQVEVEARRLGVIYPEPGKHMKTIKNRLMK